jgi:outer membrane protein OmpA-like peptidoglycan-associated protein
MSLVFALVATTLTAQPNVSEQQSDDEISVLTKDPKGGVYPPKPKDMWVLGLSVGSFGIAGDVVPRSPFSGYGFGLNVRKSLGYSWSLRGEFFYGRGYGQDFFGYGAATTPVSELTALGYSNSSPFVFNHQTTYSSLGVHAVYSFTNIKFHGSASKLGIYGMAGLGVYSVDTKYDAKDAAGNAYDHVNLLLQDLTSLNNGSIDRKEYLNRAEDKLSSLQDGEYETDAAAYTIGGQKIKYLPALHIGFGVAYRLSDRFAVAIEPQFHIQTNDYLDGRAYRTPEDLSGSVDIPVYIPVRLDFFLGDSKKKELPLWWVNPLDKPYEAIAANTKKKDAAEMLKDSDNDGIPDLLDKEQDTPAGAEVNTQGVTLDSDKDGIPNHLDKEPYSPVGYKIDPQTGISEKPKMPQTMTKDDILAIGKEQGWGKATTTSTGINDWFLPMIHFDNDSYTVKGQSYSALGQVAAVMQKYPSITVVVEGHASSDASTRYNEKLSYRRAKAAIDYLVKNHGIDRSRLVLRYNGESAPLVKTATTNYMNRRVEFRVSNGETEMSAPK